MPLQVCSAGAQGFVLEHATVAFYWGRLSVNFDVAKFKRVVFELFLFKYFKGNSLLKMWL